MSHQPQSQTFQNGKSVVNEINLRKKILENEIHQLERELKKQDKIDRENVKDTGNHPPKQNMKASKLSPR